MTSTSCETWTRELRRVFVFDTSSIIAVKERYARQVGDRLYRELRS